MRSILSALTSPDLLHASSSMVRLAANQLAGCSIHRPPGSVGSTLRHGRVPVHRDPILSALAERMVFINLERRPLGSRCVNQYDLDGTCANMVVTMADRTSIEQCFCDSRHKIMEILSSSPPHCNFHVSRCGIHNAGKPFFRGKFGTCMATRSPIRSAQTRASASSFGTCP